MDCKTLMFQTRQQNLESSTLKNKYLASCLAYLSKRPFLISRLFETAADTPVKVICLWLCLSGAWTVVVIDNLLPMYLDIHNAYEPFNLRATPSTNDSTDFTGLLWPSYLEKALAKAFSSYWEIKKGHPLLTLRDLTSFPIVELELVNKADKWVFLKEKVEAAELDIVVGLRTGKRKYKVLKNGLVHGVLYSVEGMYELMDEEGLLVRLVQLQSTLQEGRWNQDFGEFSSKWTKRLRRAVSHVDKTDGNFFMKFDDFLTHFAQVLVIYFSKSRKTLFIKYHQLEMK